MNVVSIESARKTPMPAKRDIAQQIVFEAARIVALAGTSMILEAANMLSKAGENRSAGVLLETCKWVHGELERVKDGRHENS